MNRSIAATALFLAMTGCASPTKELAHNPPATKSESDVRLSVFSSSPAGGLPEGWEPLIILRNKKTTEYQLVHNDSRTVLHARAESASSGLMHQVNIDPQKQPWLHWQWKIANPLKAQDNTQRATEDSPVRIILGFDGDKDTLPFADQILFETARVVTGHDFPYATLMYIWGGDAPVDSVIRSPHSGRIKMIVAENGTGGIGEWRQFARNIVEDYEKAYGEKPGRLIGVGVLTDTDNTGETVEAWYGDIALLRERVASAPAEPRAQPLYLSQRK